MNKVSNNIITVTVFGWLNESFEGNEQETNHTLWVGYWKGAQQLQLNFMFSVHADNHDYYYITGKGHTYTLISNRIYVVALCYFIGIAKEYHDYVVQSNIVRAPFLHNDPVAVEVTFKVDGIALESNETAMLELAVPSETALKLDEEGIFFRRTIQLHIMDSDGM